MSYSKEEECAEQILFTGKSHIIHHYLSEIFMSDQVVFQNLSTRSFVLKHCIDKVQ